MNKIKQSIILIVEDDLAIAKSLSAYLSVFGFESLTAGDINAAFKIIESDPRIQVVVADFNLPGGTGVELLQKIKAKRVDLPHFFIISGSHRPDVEDFFHLGAEGFLPKPFRAKTLLEVIRKSLLPKTQRFSQPTIHPQTVLVETIKTWTLEQKTSNFRLGRGGFYIETSQKLVEENEAMNIQLQLGEHLVEGVAILRWKRPSKKKAHLVAGFEIVSLSGESSKTFQSIMDGLEDPAFIPSPSPASQQLKAV